ncbi:UvrD-helicase domain-containing protein, partial [uncultured Muribaculum sp.]|uniref:UvrD-helicase domain-containing protein n=1 Tax=uncultured Muribaculum sp. TaxID=1918613 RepID=UPI0025A5F7E8
MLNIHKASAGSGKTYTLTYNYIKLLLGAGDEQGNYRLASDRKRHRAILAITFTNKATDEMKRRIVQQLAMLAHVDAVNGSKSDYEERLCKELGCDSTQLANAARDALFSLLGDYGFFNVSTIDAFFQTVLRTFAREAELTGNYEVELPEEAAECREAPILMTNYERVRDGDMDPAAFCAAALDEASVLRSFGNKTYQTFLDKFRGVKYKLVCTATPSPNKYKELIHYAGYLEVMDTGQALTRFFQRDSTKANNLTLYPHKEDEFWLWLSTWALVITKPSDLGYDDAGYSLPPLEVRRHVVGGHYNDNQDRDGQYKIINDAAMSLPEASREKRESIAARVAKAKEIVDSDPEEHFLLWHDLEAERHAICAAMPETVDIYGAMDYDERERRVIDFSEGKTRLFATKKSLSGSGCNFQRHCHRAVFVGIDYEFNDFIQAIH